MRALVLRIPPGSVPGGLIEVATNPYRLVSNVLTSKMLMGK